MYVTNLFESARSKPPVRSGFYLAYLEDKTIKLLYYSTRHDTWTTTNIEADSAFSRCFSYKVLAWAKPNAIAGVLSRERWN